MLTPEIRTRSISGTDFLLRTENGHSPRYYGHAAVFDSRTAIGNPLTWGFYEQIARSAFDKTLQEGDARFLVDHNTHMIVSRVSAGDLRLSTDWLGLFTDSDLDQELSYVRDMTRNVEAKRITGMSFGFRVIKDDWQTEMIEATDTKGGLLNVEVDIRTLLEVQLFEVSAVTFPAYEDTDAGLRSAARAIAHHGDDALIAKRSHPDFLAAFDEIAAPENRQPTRVTGDAPEPTERTTPPEEPDAATRGIDLLRMRHRHLGTLHGLPGA